MPQRGLAYDPAFRGDAPVPQGPPRMFEGQTRGRYPRMLVLDDETEDRLKDFLHEEINAARVEKEPLVENFETWQEDYWAEPAQSVKNWPFKKAANIVVPLTAIAVEAIHARLMNTIHAVEPFWSIRPKSEAWIDAAKPCERWLQTEVENPNALNVYDFTQNALLELTKLGTAIGKSGYERDIRKSGRGENQPYYFQRHNGATLDWVPVANFLMRMSEQDPQKSTWCGEEHTFTWSEMKSMAGSGRMMSDAVEEVRRFWVSAQASEGGEDPQEDYRDTVDGLASTEPVWNAEFRVQEVWVAFDVNGDGWDEEIVVDFHYMSRTILSIRYNWYQDLHRPYRISQYVKMEGRWPGIGVGKQNEQFQKEATTIRRQRLDNATLANMRMIAIKRSSDYGPGEPVFPGKMWFLDDPQADIQPIEMSEIYQSSVVNEQSVIRDSEKRTGVNEVILGMPDEGTPGTATGDLARIAEGNKRFDLVLKNVRRWLGLLGIDVLSNYQQFGDQQRHFTILGEDGAWVERIFQMPGELVRHGAIVDLTATDSTVNRQVEQQQWMSLQQVLTNYFGQILEIGQLLVEMQAIDPQQYAMMAQRALLAADETTKRLLETFNVTEPERLLFAPEEQPGTPQQGVNGGGGLDSRVSGRANGGPGGGLPGSPTGPGLEAILRAAQGSGDLQGRRTDLGRLATQGR